MRMRLAVSLVTSCFTALPNLLAAQLPAAHVYETQEGSNTEYAISNTSNLDPIPFDITMLVVSTTSANPNPSTSNLNWIAESLSASTWTQAMGGGVSTLPSWQQYTGMSYTLAFPGDPVRLNGYFLNYTFDSGSGDASYPGAPIFPNQPVFGGFFFQGAPDSTFLVVGPTNSTQGTPLSQLRSYESVAVIVPEPAALSLCLLALGGGALVGRRKRRS